jgi:hypothetical protein
MVVESFDRKPKAQMKFVKILIILLLLSWTLPLWAFTPMEYYNSLVAGNDDDAGFQDGAFDDARFNQPSGLAFDEEGKRLLVADYNNNRIRVIYLEENNRVETLAGNGDNKNLDGSLDKASFSGPYLLARLPDDQFAVFESGDHSIRIVDLKNRNVTTLATGLGTVWSLVYWPIDQGLYFSTPDSGVLQRLDLKNKKLTTLLTNNSQVPRPKALGLCANKLYVSDGVSSNLFQVEPVMNTLNAGATVHLEMAGSGKNIEELTATGESLYALQSNGDTFAEVLPQYRAVNMATAWGFISNNNSTYYSPYLGIQTGRTAGFAGSPNEMGKFYISSPNNATNSIVSIKDYNFDKQWFAGFDRGPAALNDFDYPAKKPAKTFRILIIGTSRVLYAPAVPLDVDGNEVAFPNRDEYDTNTPRVVTFPKKLEFLLNSEAALDGISEHFEVLVLGHVGINIQDFAAEEAPSLVKKYDIDLVLGMLFPSPQDNFDVYYDKPITKDGIPSDSMNVEYLLKPWKERIPDGAPKRLLDECFKQKLVKEISPNKLQFSLFQDLLLGGNKEIRSDLMEMLGKPFKVLKEKIDPLTTSSGNKPKVAFFFIPSADCESYAQYETFWSDICGQYGLSLMDLSKPYEDLKLSYFPTTQACCWQHYTAYGNELIATILKHELISRGWIPFEEKK